jgi:hypothetical protein
MCERKCPKVWRGSLVDRLPAGGHDLHIGNGDSSRSAAGSYRQAVALRELGSDEVVEHLQVKAVAEHERCHRSAARIEGDQLERPMLIIRQVFSRAPRHTGNSQHRTLISLCSQFGAQARVAQAAAGVCERAAWASPFDRFPAGVGDEVALDPNLSAAHPHGPGSRRGEPLAD